MRNCTQARRANGVVRIALSSFAGAALIAIGCNRTPEANRSATPGAPTVVVGIAPIAYFAERLAGDAIQIKTLVEPGRSPHSFAPTPRQVAELESAAGFIAIGLPFEQRLVEKIRANFPKLPICDASAGVEHIEATHQCEEDEHVEGADPHEHGAADPHIWLDPKRARRIAANVAAELKRVAPGHEAEFSERLAAVDAELVALDAELTEWLAPLRGRSFIVFHPAYGYFADSYGLTQISIEVQGKDPTPTDVVRVVNEARRAGVKVIFYQPQYSSRSAEVIASEIGGVVEPLDPLAHDYLAQLRHMAQRVSEALAGEKP